VSAGAGAGAAGVSEAGSGITPAAAAAVAGPAEGRPDLLSVRGLTVRYGGVVAVDDVCVDVTVGLTASTGRRDGNGDDDLAHTLDLLGLTDVADRAAGELSQGQRQLVSIARALAGRPRVLLLDEPAGGLDTTESQWLAQRLRVVRDSGVTILMVEHDMSMVLSLCDEIHVLNFGKVIAHGTPAQIRANPAVAEAYLGSTHAAGQHAAETGDLPAAATGGGRTSAQEVTA
jgi:ABC-type branched-subunit amino acid transport system ATPase component